VIEPDDRTTEAAAVRDAYATARELLLRAEEDAARIRAEADRYVRQRHLEVELVVAKARRLLAIAEERAAALDAGTAPLAPAASSAAEPDTVIDLTGDDAVRDSDPAPGVGRRSTGFDSILAGAVSRAIERALPTDR
jgi:hypothetical protein